MKQVPASSTAPLATTDELNRIVTTARALWTLTKPRLAFFSILTAMAAYGATQSGGGLLLACWVLLGTSFSAGGALSLNHWWERDLDRLMNRTCDRPLPRNELSPAVALGWSILLSVSGILILAFLVNGWAALFAAATICIYGFIYTPLKRRSRWATEVGSISGALPPLIGSAAAGDVLAGPGVTLFLILLFWQMPHFYAIGWMYRSDYQAAKFPLLPAVDQSGVRTACWSIVYTVLLVAVSLLPLFLRWLGFVYGIVAVVGGCWFLWAAVKFLIAARDSSIPADSLRPVARTLFLASVKYLPAILVAMVLDRLL